MSLTAIHTSEEGQARIEGRSKTLPKDFTDEQWRDSYVGFSGYFGHHSPSVFAAAPELLEALQSIADCCDEEHEARDYASRQAEIRGIARAAIAKASAAVLPYVEVTE